MTDNSNMGRKPLIVIIGGGFGGVALGQNLKHADVEVLMIDKHNYHTFQPLLYQVATGALEADSIGFPIRRIFTPQKNFSFRLAEVKRIDTDKKTVITSTGNVQYDYLVIATGANTNFFGNQQIEHFSMPMKNIPEALNIRSHILQTFEKALIVPTAEEAAALLTFVIVGGGPTGVELSGALADICKYILPKDYPTLKPSDMKIYLIEGKPALIAAMSEGASTKAKDFLTNMGVMIYNGLHVQSYDGNELKIDNGMTIQTHNVFWTAGVMGEMPEGLSKDVVLKGNRIKTDGINRVEGLNNVFAIGDVAAMITAETPNGYPGVAPVAMQQGKHLAKNIVHLLKSEPTVPFKYFDKGTMATIGRNKAVADIGKWHFQGFFAWLTWMFVHVLLLAGFTNKAIVFLNWSLSYFTRNTDNRLIIRGFDDNTMMTDPIAR